MAKFGLNMKIFILPQSDTNLIKDFLPAKYLPNKKTGQPSGWTDLIYWKYRVVYFMILIACELALTM